MKRHLLHLLGTRALATVVLLASAVIVTARSTKIDVKQRLPVEPDYHLRMFHTHTGERIDVVYRRGESYLPAGLTQLNHFLRDHRTGAVHEYDPRLFDLLTAIEQRIGHPEAEIDVICGYRSPWSNEFLRQHTIGVALHSLHTQAEAIDIRIPGISTLALRNAVLALKLGGVGYYPASGFVHVDVGRVRQWSLGGR